MTDDNIISRWKELIHTNFGINDEKIDRIENEILFWDIISMKKINRELSDNKKKYHFLIKSYQITKTELKKRDSSQNDNLEERVYIKKVFGEKDTIFVLPNDKVKEYENIIKKHYELKTKKYNLFNVKKWKEKRYSKLITDLYNNWIKTEKDLDNLSYNLSKRLGIIKNIYKCYESKNNKIFYKLLDDFFWIHKTFSIRNYLYIIPIVFFLALINEEIVTKITFINTFIYYTSIYLLLFIVIPISLITYNKLKQ